MLDQEEIKLEIKSGYYSRLLTNKRLLFIITALILVFLILIYNSLSYNMISPLIVILLIISTTLLFGFALYIGSADRIVILNNEGIEIRFGALSQRSTWKSLEGIEFNLNPTMKKEQIVFREQERSWPIVNLDFKEEGWNELRALIYKYGEKNKITIKS